MPGHHFLLDLLAGVALLLWATRLVKTGIMRAFGQRLRRIIAGATVNRVLACMTGAGVATALQSSTASALLVTSFLDQGFIAPAMALALLLGANIGTTIVVQVLSFDLSALAPVLLVGGVSVFLSSRRTTLRNLGRAAIGLALMAMALQIVGRVADPLRANGVLVLVLQQLALQPVLALVIGALLAWLLHSSVAVVLLIMSLAGGGVIGTGLALALTLGANVGSGIAPLALSLRAPGPARRALAANLATRMAGALAVLAFCNALAPTLARLESDPMRQVADFHTAFNIALALIFLPFVERSARLAERLLPDRQDRVGEHPLPLLDEADFDNPSVALVAASREVIRLAGFVEVMLREAIITFEERDGTRRDEISRLDSTVDDLQESIKLYLTRLTRTPLDEDTSRKAFDLILFTTNLEHVGDILDKSFLDLAAKKQRLGLSFSTEGWAEIQAIHREAVEQMRLAITVFMTQDRDMARRLVEAKDRIRGLERSAAQNHLMRLRAGTVASIETSSVHLDVIRDLKRIVAHLTAVAYPILEAGGELSTSRLRIRDAARSGQALPIR
jgi:phosphate:Na+ symporter